MLKGVSRVGSGSMPGLEALSRRMEAMKRASVSVGFPSGPTYPDGTSVAKVAAWNEFGTEHIPERPFLRTGLKRALPGAKELNRVTIKKVIAGTMTVLVALDLLGEFAVGEVKHALLTGPWVPNAPSTIKRKGSDKPLFDTGQMFQSVTHRVGGLA